MIQPISYRPLQNGKYFSILKLMILHQNISSVWIFGDQYSWYQDAPDVNAVLQHLVGTIPQYVFDLDTTRKTMCVDSEVVKSLNIFFVSESFGWKQVDAICSTDFTVVLVHNSSAKIDLPEKRSRNIFQTTVFGTIIDSDIVDVDIFPSQSRSYVPMHDLFIERPINLHAADLRIFFRIQLPNSMLYKIDNSFVFLGTDSLMAYEITKWLNGTAVIQTNAGYEYPSYISGWANTSGPKYQRSLELIEIYNGIKPPRSSLVHSVYRNCSNSDICISPQPIGDYLPDTTEFLHPHTIDCLRLVVPRISTQQQFAVKLGQNGIVQSMTLAALLMFLYKIIFNRSHRPYDWQETLFELLAVLFGQKRHRYSSKMWETIWNGQLILLVIFGTAALSAITYQSLVSVKYVSQIDTLDDLIKSNLDIYVEESKMKDFKKWGAYLDPRLRSKLVLKNEMIMSMKNQLKAAYVWDEMMAMAHIFISESMAPIGQPAAVRLARDPFGCGFSSLRVNSGPTIRRSIDELSHHMFESGIKKAHTSWALQYSRVSNRKRRAPGQHSKFHPLMLSRSYGIFWILMGGICLGCIAFVLEILWKRFTVSIYETLQWRIMTKLQDRIGGRSKRYINGKVRVKRILPKKNKNPI